jgi:hypothetical protein
MSDNETQILKDFLLHLDSFYKDLGLFTGEKNKAEFAREILTRFYSNLVCLENHLHLKDSLSSALIQRYNHELTLDFYYMLDPWDDEGKLQKFFNYTNLSRDQKWSLDETKVKRTFIPQLTGDNSTFTALYKTLSNMAHSNIISIQLNRRGEEFEFRIIKGAILLCVVDISACLNHKPLRDLFPNINWEPVIVKNVDFQERAKSLCSL